MTRLARFLVAMALLASGCAPAIYSGGPLEPLVVGTEQYVTIDWRAEPRGQGVVVWGYVGNGSPYTFDRVRLLIDALGPNGELLSQRLVWSVGLLGGWGRNYFEAPMEPAAGYRVRVFSWDRVETDGGRFRGPFW